MFATCRDREYFQKLQKLKLLKLGQCDMGGKLNTSAFRDNWRLKTFKVHTCEYLFTPVSIWFTPVSICSHNWRSRPSMPTSVSIWFTQPVAETPVSICSHNWRLKTFKAHTCEYLFTPVSICLHL